MKKYTDQGKVDTRSGFGAGLVKAAKVCVRAFLIVISFFFYLSCYSPTPFKEPEEGAEVFFCGYDCEINGEKVEYSNFRRYSNLDYSRGDFNPPLFAFSGYSWSEDKRLSGVKYDELAFYLGLPLPSSLSLGEGSLKERTLFFRVEGDGKGPFREGIEYASSNNTVLLYPDRSVLVFGNYAYSYELPGNVNLTANMLSSSLKFGFRDVEEQFVDEVLDFYFAFEQVTEEGDTIRVTNGHFVQSLYFLDKYFINSFITE